jgi:histone deacetylase 3
MKKFNIPLLVLGGGGYTPRNVARAWAFETSLLVNEQISNEIPYSEYFEYFAPDFTLLLDKPCGENMHNGNTKNYLENIVKHSHEMLRQVEHSPSVQMQYTPEDAFESEALEQARILKRERTDEFYDEPDRKERRVEDQEM